ncbi:MAG: PAS domain S-box protein, partial [Bacteroidota bacterium]
RMLGYRSLREFQRERERVSATYADPAIRDDLVQRLRQFGQVSQYELDLRARDGRFVHVRVNARTVADEHGRPRFFEGTVEDVTAHRDAQERLRRSEERFRALVRHSSDIIAVLDEDGRMGYVSPALLPMLGRHPEETTGQTYHSILHPDECRRVGVLFRHALRRRGALPTVEVRLRHASGHYLFVEVTGTNRLGDAHLSGLILNVRDITDRKRAETVLRKSKEHAEEVAQFKSSFLANMSHEIRTPLTGILGFSSVLAEEVTDEHHREFVRLISKSGHRLLDTLNSVLDLARLEAGRMELEAESMRIGEAVREGVALLVPLAEEKGLALNVEVTAPEACALLDPGALSRIINNLVGNAIKFTERGEVCVLVEDQAGLVRIRVRDTGPGIDEAFLPRIFSEFEQASRGIGRDHEGSGLGLTITQRLVEKLGGAIEVKSVLGTGTTFTVTFPRTDVPAPAMPEPALPQTEAVAASVAQPHVLVVDDNQQTRFLMERMLRANFQVDTAASAEEAYQRTDAHAYDAILLDINLGANASGEDVMRHLRSQDRYATTPIVAFTAYALPGDRERFLNQGFDGYLSKPFTRKQLGALMDAMLPGTMQTTESETPSLLLGPYAPRPTAGREAPTSQPSAPAWQPLDLQTAPDGDA